MATDETPRRPDPAGASHPAGTNDPAGTSRPTSTNDPAGASEQAAPTGSPDRGSLPGRAHLPGPRRAADLPSAADAPGSGGPSVVTRGRSEILGRLRTALADRPRPPAIPRDYRHSTAGPPGDGPAGSSDGSRGATGGQLTDDGAHNDRLAAGDRAIDRRAITDQLTDRLEDYRASVHPCTPARLAETLGELLADVERLAVPGDLPREWLTGYHGVLDVDPAEVSALDRADAVLTGCAVAIAETGTIVLDAGVAQGRRALTLVPDRHLCVVRADQVVTGVPEGLAALTDPTRPLTFISGPSATSDIELSRVEGVHGPRRLQVILVGDST